MDGLLQNEALNGFVQHGLVRRYIIERYYKISLSIFMT